MELFILVLPSDLPWIYHIFKYVAFNVHEECSRVQLFTMQILLLIQPNVYYREQ